jgi:hypothetical protein
MSVTMFEFCRNSDRAKRAGARSYAPAAYRRQVPGQVAGRKCSGLEEADDIPVGVDIDLLAARS